MDDSNWIAEYGKTIRLSLDVCVQQISSFLFSRIVSERSKHSFIHSKCIQNIDRDWEGEET